jgi:hypothetical protein
MAKPRVFVSYDIENDKDILELLVGQARQPDSPLEVSDWSNKDVPAGAPADKRSRIAQVDGVVVLCGEMTHKADGVSEELTIARTVGTPYLLLWGRKGMLVSSPAAADPTDHIHEWTWAALEQLVQNAV